MIFTWIMKLWMLKPIFAMMQSAVELLGQGSIELRMLLLGSLMYWSSSKQVSSIHLQYIVFVYYNLAYIKFPKIINCIIASLINDQVNFALFYV